MDLALKHGVMGEYMMVGGRIKSNMDMATLLTKMAQKEIVNTKMAKESDGSAKSMIQGKAV